VHHQSTSAAPGAAPRTAAPASPQNSIAVLPFENLSDDKANAYFAEGIQDEILTRLSKVAALKVISRTSTQKYKSAPDNLREIGQQLGVANILEGSVQKVANAVHVNVQLIRAGTDEHLWAESYNRKLDDVFAVEGEVAGAIADQLNTKISGTEQQALTARPTQNPAAYDAYLRALSIEHSSYAYDSYTVAERDYARAVELDPNFGLAWARLAIIRSFLYFNAVDANNIGPGSVKIATERARALAPEAGESWIAEGAYRYRVLRDFKSALAAYQEAQKRLPNSSLVNQYMAYVLRRLGRWSEAEPLYKKAVELDPRDVQLLNSMATEFYSYLRRFDDALAILDRALQVAPDSTTTAANKASVLQNIGRLDDARRELAKIPAGATDDFTVSALLSQALYDRHFEEAIRIVDHMVGSVPAGQPLDSIAENFIVLRGLCQEWLGNKDEARKSFERAVHDIKPTPETVVNPDANGLPSTLALAYAGLGQKDQALAQAQRSVDQYAGDAVNQPGAEMVLAQIQARFGLTDAAIAALPHLLEVPSGITVANLQYDPMWDPIRKDPRFQKLTGAGN
jgi:TolB-like protein/Tfp pilus assembly protein PilF